MFCDICDIDLSVWNKSLSQRWRRIRRRCSSFTTNNTNTDSPDSTLQKQYLLETSGSSVESPKVMCADSSLCTSKDASDENVTKRINGDVDATINGLPDVSHLLRIKFNKFQNGFRKRRAMSVHESISRNDKNQTTFYVPTPTCSADEVEDEMDAVKEVEPASLPTTVVLNRVSCSRINYRKSPSECSSGRGTVTPTEEFDNDSSGSNQSSKSFHFRKYSYEERNDKNGYWDQGYHSIEYSPDNVPHRCNYYSNKGRLSNEHNMDDPNNLSLFRDQCSIPSSSIRLSSKCEKVPTMKYVHSTAYRVSLHSNLKFRNSYAYTYDNCRALDSGMERKYQNQRGSVNYDNKMSISNYEAGTNSIAGKTLNGNSLTDNRYYIDSSTKVCTSLSKSKLNVRDGGVNESRRKPIHVNEIDEDQFDENLILRNEPKTRSCRRWSQTDTLAIDSKNAGKLYSSQNSFRIGERVSVDNYEGCQLPYAALQSIEPMSMPYNPAPPIPIPRNSDRNINKISSNLRRRSTRSVSPESRKKETEAREKRQQIVHNLQKYVDQKRKGIVGCKSNADLTNSSENDFWKKEDLNEKVSKKINNFFISKCKRAFLFDYLLCDRKIIAAELFKFNNQRHITIATCIFINFNLSKFKKEQWFNFNNLLYKNDVK
ncbi:hypothetical protein PGB90_001082 [Kerria lacca]